MRLPCPIGKLYTFKMVQFDPPTGWKKGSLPNPCVDSLEDGTSLMSKTSEITYFSDEDWVAVKHIYILKKPKGGYKQITDTQADGIEASFVPPRRPPAVWGEPLKAEGEPIEFIETATLTPREVAFKVCEMKDSKEKKDE